MRKLDIRSAAAVLATVLALTAIQASRVSAAGSTTCCFTNARYSGVCEVTPEGGETCASILAYLNNAQSMGKTYCGSTNVRNGWRQARCATPAPKAR